MTTTVTATRLRDQYAVYCDRCPYTRIVTGWGEANRVADTHTNECEGTGT